MLNGMLDAPTRERKYSLIFDSSIVRGRSQNLNDYEVAAYGSAADFFAKCNFDYIPTKRGDGKRGSSR
jgi:hypothetical protein